MIKIDINKQVLECERKYYKISSAKNGVGEMENSFCTPTGKFKISEKFGHHLKINSVFKGRIFTGEIYTKDLLQKHPNQDWILSRILWLEGVEEHNKNTKNRYIYIHGTADEAHLGMPVSKGCIRMKNTDIIKLFNQVSINEKVIIQ